MKKFTQTVSLLLLFFGLLPVAYAQTAFKVKSSNGANIRQGPGTDKQLVSSIPAGAKVKVVDKSNAGWYKVEYNGKTGYVSTSLIEEDTNESAEKKTSNTNTASSGDRNNTSNNHSASQSSQGQKNNTSNANKNSTGSTHNKSKSSTASNGNYNWGIGLRLGDPAGLTVKRYKGNNAWEFNLGRSSRWGYNYGNSFYRYAKYDDKKAYHYYGHSVGFSTALQVHYLWQKPINGADGLSFYYGGGAQARFTPVTYRYYYNEDTFIREDRVTNIDLGLDGTLGLEYKFNNAPVSMFLDATLFMEVVDAPFLFSGQGGIGVRYNF